MSFNVPQPIGRFNMDLLYALFAGAGAGLAVLIALVSLLASNLPSCGLEHAATTRQKWRLRLLQCQYLIVYGCASLGDWLQGPYFYKVYEANGFSRHKIQALFVVGFASAAVCGTVTGTLADSVGRKKVCIIYFVVYILCTMSVHVEDSYPVLVAGRVMGGMATCLLFTTFEAWVVAEHQKLGLPAKWVADTFKYAGLANFLMAISAGLCAEPAVDHLTEMKLKTELGNFVFFGVRAPYELAALVMFAGIIATFTLWRENYGSDRISDSAEDVERQANVDGIPSGGFDCNTEHSAATGSYTLLESEEKKPTPKLKLMFLAFIQALKEILSTPAILATGCVSSCFEAAMYAFVIVWTPALGTDPEPPVGFIFAAFMSGAMLGSQGFGIFSRVIGVHATLFLSLLTATASLAIPVIWLGDGNGDTQPWWFLAFFVFELCVGMYFPCISTVRAMLIDESSRSAVYAVIRAPLNALVAGILLSGLSVRETLGAAAVLLAIATVSSLAICMKCSAKKNLSKIMSS